MLARIRKAVIAGVGAGIAAAAAVVVKAAETGTLGEETTQQAIGAFIAAGTVMGWATGRVPNATA
jgi:hypothetical protein